ncbi:MAG: hypothetical protein HYY06_29650 [Deltaproteobacteria bacterium]|nr:hypothetical protein [Deltaproteobacteria bacterium]
MRRLRTITRIASVLPAALRPLTAPVVDSRGPRRQVLGRVEGAIVDEHGSVTFFVVRVHETGRASRKRVLVPLPVVWSLERGRNPAIVIGWSHSELRTQPDFTGDAEIPGEARRAGGLRLADASCEIADADVLRGAIRWGAIAAAAGALVGWVFWGGPAAALTSLCAGVLAASAGALGAALKNRPGMDRQGAAPWLRALEGELRKTAPFEEGILRER